MVKGKGVLYMSVNDEIENKATEIAKKYNDEFPVNPIAIATRNGIKVYEKELKDTIDGGIVKRINGQYEIYVNSNMSLARKRFTIAHELGHYFLHQSQQKEGTIVDYRDYDSSIGVSQREIAANNFAAALLMNRDSIIKAWKENNSFYYVADMYGVSVSAVKYRLKNLKVI